MRMSLPAIPTGLCPPAQGCEATLGEQSQIKINPNGVVATPAWGRWQRIGRNRVAVGEVLETLTQGSAKGATLGFGPESRWDSPTAALRQIMHAVDGFEQFGEGHSKICLTRVRLLNIAVTTDKIRATHSLAVLHKEPETIGQRTWQYGQYHGCLWSEASCPLEAILSS